MNTLQLVGAIVTLLGSIFLFLAALGVIRMPDVYNQVQAGTKATTLGTILVLIGVSIYWPAWIPKLVILFLFIIITNPISSHVLARAAHRVKVPMSKLTKVDMLAEKSYED